MRRDSRNHRYLKAIAKTTRNTDKNPLQGSGNLTMSADATTTSAASYDPNTEFCHERVVIKSLSDCLASSRWNSLYKFLSDADAVEGGNETQLTRRLQELGLAFIEPTDVDEYLTHVETFDIGSAGLVPTFKELAQQLWASHDEGTRHPVVAQSPNRYLKLQQRHPMIPDGQSITVSSIQTFLIITLRYPLPSSSPILH